MDAQRQPLIGETKIDVTILDGIVGVNALFTAAVFLGLIFSPDDQSIETNMGCEASTSITKQLVLFEVISFSCFLFSSIAALGLKMEIVALNAQDRNVSSNVLVNLRHLNFGMSCSWWGSLGGCVFLIASIVQVIQIRFGILSCHSLYTLVAFVFLCLVVSAGLVVYIYVSRNAFRAGRN